MRARWMELSLVVIVALVMGAAAANANGGAAKFQDMFNRPRLPDP